MDHASQGLDLRTLLPLPPGLNQPWPPQDRTAALALLVRGDELMDESEPELALPFYQAATASAERDVVAAGYFGAGTALYRLDREIEARQAWQTATSVGETPISYRAWRQVAAALVREGDLQGALQAYRQCERRAPREDRPEIASRLGWLNKETGNSRAAARQFARSRGDALPMFMTYAIIGVTALVSLAAYAGSQNVRSGLGGPLEQQLEMDKIAIAHGELYRLLSVVLVHDPSSLLHLLFNMYAFWFAGQIVERMYGPWRMLAFYVVCALGGSIGTYVFGDANYGVGASGAIFGFFGIVLVATRFHHPMLDAQSRMIASQIGFLIVLNLVLGFSGFFNVDNFAHLGGLATGLWLGWLLPPSQVATLASFWQSTRAGASPGMVLAAKGLGLAALAAVMIVGLIIGTDNWGKYPAQGRSGQTPTVLVVAPRPAASSSQVVARTEGVENAIHVPAVQPGSLWRPDGLVASQR
jgi:rhomboid protease GluP